MNRRHIHYYLSMMLAGFGAISLSILFYFVLYRFDEFTGVLRTLGGILAPFVYGAVIAFLLKPVCNWLERRLQQWLRGRWQRLAGPAAIFCSMLFGLLMVYAVLIMIVPNLVDSIISLSATVRVKLDQLLRWAQRYFADNPALLTYIQESYNTAWNTFQQWIRDTLAPSVQSLVSGLGLGVWNLLMTLKNLLIGLIAAVYMLASRKRFAEQGRLVLYSVLKPAWAKVVLEELAYADRMFSGFVSGKIIDSAIIGVLCYIVCVIVRFPNALLVSAIVGVTNIIPFFGPFIGAVPATLLILIEDPIKAIWFVVFVFILQQLDGNVIGPKILGDTTGLSSFWVLFSILLFGGLWGFAGMLIGVPLFAVIYDVLKKLVRRGLARHGCPDMMDRYHDRFGESDHPHAPIESAPACEAAKAQQAQQAPVPQQKPEQKPEQEQAQAQDHARV